MTRRRFIAMMMGGATWLLAGAWANAQPDGWFRLDAGPGLDRGRLWGVKQYKIFLPTIEKG